MGVVCAIIICIFKILVGVTVLCLSRRGRRALASSARASGGNSGGGKRITQNEFTDKAWQAIIAAPDVAKQVQPLPHSPAAVVQPF